MARILLTAALLLLLHLAHGDSYPGADKSAAEAGTCEVVWNNTPAPLFQEDVAASYNLLDDASESCGAAITFANETGCTLPTGTTINNTTKKLDYSGTGTNGTTTGCVFSADNGPDSVNSSAFEIQIANAPEGANLIWEGGAETGDYLEYPPSPDSLTPAMTYHQVPRYGRPINYHTTASSSVHVGDGSLNSIVRYAAQGVYLTGPVACGDYAFKSTMKSTSNSALTTGCSGANLPACECDGSSCTRRRAQAHNLTDTVNVFWPDALSELQDRRLFFAVYIPSNWPFSGTGWGPQIFQIKDSAGQGSPTIEMELQANGSWEIFHRWTSTNAQITAFPSQQGMFYSGNYDGQPYPRSDFWPQGLVDFPNTATSHAELQNVNVGGWTFFLINIRFDWRGSDAGGTGYFELWKCDDDEEDCSVSANYTQILDIVPHQTTRNSVTFNHGIGFNNTTNEFGHSFGLYSQSTNVHATINRDVYHDCVKIGDENSTFDNMLYDVN